MYHTRRVIGILVCSCSVWTEMFQVRMTPQGQWQSNTLRWPQSHSTHRTLGNRVTHVSMAIKQNRLNSLFALGWWRHRWLWLWLSSVWFLSLCKHGELTKSLTEPGCRWQCEGRRRRQKGKKAIRKWQWSKEKAMDLQPKVPAENHAGRKKATQVGRKHKEEGERRQAGGHCCPCETHRGATRRQVPLRLRMEAHRRKHKGLVLPSPVSSYSKLKLIVLVAKEPTNQSHCSLFRFSQVRGCMRFLQKRAEGLHVSSLATLVLYLNKKAAGPSVTICCLHPFSWKEKQKVAVQGSGSCGCTRLFSLGLQDNSFIYVKNSFLLKIILGSLATIHRLSVMLCWLVLFAGKGHLHQTSRLWILCYQGSNMKAQHSGNKPQRLLRAGRAAEECRGP